MTRFAEDFRLGEQIRHAPPRTVTEADVALHGALTGNRFALFDSRPFAEACGLPDRPVDPFLVLDLTLARSATDLLANAVAELGLSLCRFGFPVYPGDTLAARSTVIGLREAATPDRAVVWLRATAENQRQETVADAVLQAMVAKRDPAATMPRTHLPELADSVDPDDLMFPPGYDATGHDPGAAGGPALWEDFAEERRVDHGAGRRVDAAGQRLAAGLVRLGPADPPRADGGPDRPATRLAHLAALVRAQTVTGLENAVLPAAINGARPAAPLRAGDTLFAWSEVLEATPLTGRDDLGALRLRSVATANLPADGFPDRTGDAPHPAVVLELDHWVLMPRRTA